MAQASAWLRHSFLLSPSAARSLSLARCRRIQQYLLPSSLFLKRKPYPSVSASLCSSADAAASSLNFHLHNTLTKRKELFRPKDEGKVGMYVCGITAYDLSHIGHARVSVVFDVLYRYLKHLKYKVVYVRNFTDVDDKET